jgi:hypothetical protein
MWVALGVGALTLALGMAVQSLATALVLRTVIGMAHRGYAGARFWSAIAILEVTAVVLFGALLVQVALWAGVFVLCGEFGDYEAAFYHSAVNYTTLGYGDIVLSPRWRLLGPLEAANGVLMGGLAAALLFAVMSRLAEPLLRHLKARADTH